MSISLADVLGAVEQTLGIESQIQARQQQQATEAELNTIFGQGSATLTLLQTVNATLQSFDATVLQLLNLILDQLHTIQAIMGEPQQSGIAVRLPTTPPAGYGAPSTSAIATEVWQYHQFSFERPAWQWQTAAGFNAVTNQEALIGKPVSGKNYYLVVANWSDDTFSNPNPASAPDLDISTILPTDATVFAWVTRQYSTFAWFNDGFGAPAVNDVAGNGYWVVAMTSVEFAQAKGAGGGTAVRVPPVWPGLTHVTLGTSLALSDGLVIPGPLDGVIVAITGVAPPVSFYPFGTVKSFVRAGAIVFRDDNGNVEFPCPLGPETQVITPRDIQHPTSAILRLKTGVTGTITPWVMI